MDPREGGLVAELEGRGCVVLKREWIRSPNPYASYVGGPKLLRMRREGAREDTSDLTL